MRNLYVIQPYEVGSKKFKVIGTGHSSANNEGIPDSTSTVFALKPNVDTKTNTLYQTLYPIDNVHQKEMTKPTGERLQCYQPAGRQAH